MTTDTTFVIDQTRYFIGQLEPRDVESLVPVVETWVQRDGKILRDEVTEIYTTMQQSLVSESDYFYVVLRNESGKAIGMMGLRAPEEKMLEYKSSPDTKAAELISVFMSKESRGHGLGYKLLLELFANAKKRGYNEIIWNSGPRYKETAWSFYTKTVGKPVAIVEAYYGYDDEGTPLNAPVWRKAL